MVAWMLCGVLLAAVVYLALRLWLLHRQMDALGASFQAHLALDTNTLLTVSTGDRHLRGLAVVLNGELRGLREERRRLQQGDQELKAAITNISHDLRTPLTSLCGYLDLLEQQDTSPTVRRYLTILRERTDALRTLTEELFRYSVITATLPQLTCAPVNLTDSLATSLAAFYGPLTQRGITPELHLPDAPVYGHADPTALHRVFGNILNNAVKYSDGDLQVTLTADGAVTFSNHASGLDQVQTERLFDRFYTVETARSSTGLGLSIAKLLTEEMGGVITATYEDGQLHIRVTFPQEM